MIQVLLCLGRFFSLRGGWVRFKSGMLGWLYKIFHTNNGLHAMCRPWRTIYATCTYTHAFLPFNWKTAVSTGNSLGLSKWVCIIKCPLNFYNFFFSISPVDRFHAFAWVKLVPGEFLRQTCTHTQIHLITYSMTFFRQIKRAAAHTSTNRGTHAYIKANVNPVIAGYFFGIN